jgi:hypothetical protein
MEHATVGDGRLAGLDGARSLPAPSHAGRHRRGEPDSRRTRSRIFAGIAGAAVAVAAVTASIAWAADKGDQPKADVSASPAAVDSDAAEWIRSALPEDAKLLTNGVAAPPGNRSSSIDRPDQDWHDFDYLLTAPGTDPPLDASVSGVWQASVPVAIFPTVQVRRIVRTPLPETLKTREADRADRLVAGTALLSNARVVASPEAQERLTNGGLDLRAAATLTALAGSMTVDVVDVEDVKAEALAGMPARAMTIHVVDASQGNVVISGMTAAFRPDQVIPTPDGTFRLHWPLRIAPLPSVN